MKAELVITTCAGLFPETQSYMRDSLVLDGLPVLMYLEASGMISITDKESNSWHVLANAPQLIGVYLWSANISRDPEPTVLFDLMYYIQRDEYDISALHIISSRSGKTRKKFTISDTGDKIADEKIGVELCMSWLDVHCPRWRDPLAYRN